MYKHTPMTKRIPEFFKPYAATMTPIAVARVLGTQMQEMNRISMLTLKAVQEQLSTHTSTLVDSETRQRTAADDSLAARITTIEHASNALAARLTAVERPPPLPPGSGAPTPESGAPTPESPAPPPAAASSTRKLRDYTTPFVRPYSSGGKVRYSLQFKNKLMKDILARDSYTNHRKRNFSSLQNCLRARDRIILAAGFVMCQHGGRASLKKMTV